MDRCIQCGFQRPEFRRLIAREGGRCQSRSVMLMPPHKTAALVQQFQHYRAIPEFVNLQHRPFLRPGKRVPNIRKCQRSAGFRRRLAARPISVVSCWHRCESWRLVANSRARQRAAPIVDRACLARASSSLGHSNTIVVCSKRFIDTSRKMLSTQNRRTLTNPARETQGTGLRTWYHSFWIRFRNRNTSVRQHGITTIGMA